MHPKVAAYVGGATVAASVVEPAGALALVSAHQSSDLEPIWAQKRCNLEPSGPILEPTGAQFAENCFDLQALICSAPEFVQVADLGFPASSFWC